MPLLPDQIQQRPGHPQKIKLDWQIAAIAKVNRAKTLYSTDADLKTIAKNFDIETVHVADLQLPPPETPFLDGLEI